MPEQVDEIIRLSLNTVESTPLALDLLLPAAENTQQLLVYVTVLVLLAAVGNSIICQLESPSSDVGMHSELTLTKVH